MASIDLDSLSVAELGKLKYNIEHAISNRKQSELLDVRRKLDELVDNSGFSLQEILEAKSVRKPVQPKYRNPENPENTWTGRGRRPIWVEQALSAGKTLEDLLI
ncbi:MAG: H-NS histone family protein [Thiothrix sp.]|nr:MAG: H-NS histone family protein [Thiothrix sp.]